MNFLMQGFPVSIRISGVRFKKHGSETRRVGTTGAIGALMTRELESIKPSSQSSESNQAKPRTIPVSVPSSATPTRKLQVRKSLDEASSSGCSSGMNRRSPETPQKMKSLIKKNTHHMPMLGSDNITLDRTPGREKSDKKATNIMEIVDVNCGNPDRSWTNTITSKLKKLGFSKLSESTV